MLSPRKEVGLDDCGAWSLPHGELPSAVNGSADQQDIRQVNQTMVYRVSKDKVNAFKQFKDGALADSGASGGIAGWDMSKANGSEDYTDLIGLQEHTARKLEIVHASFVAEAQGYGLVTCHMGQQAHMPDSKSVMSTIQMIAGGCKVFDRPKAVTGFQPYIQSPDGYKFPLKFRKGLSYMDIRPVRDDEWGNLPETWMCSKNKWDPSLFDEEVDPKWMEEKTPDVEERFSRVGHDRFGVMDFEKDATFTEGEVDAIPITTWEVEINLTMLVKDKLVDSVLECKVDGTCYHIHMSADDIACDWGDWEPIANAQ